MSKRRSISGSVTLLLLMLLRRAGTSSSGVEERSGRGGEVGDSDTTRAAVLGRLSPGRIPGAMAVKYCKNWPKNTQY